MILSDTEVSSRMQSPLNLLNRLRNINSNNKLNPSPCLPPSSDQIIDDLTDKINHSSVKSKATGILISAMDELKLRLPEINKPEKLAQIASEMSKVVNSQAGNKINESSNKPQIIIYAPQMINENSFETMVVNE